MIERNGISVKPTTNDDPEIEGLMQQENILKYMSETRAYAVPMPTEMTFRIETEGKLAGEARFKNLRLYNRKAELSIFILPEYRKKNIGFISMQLLLEIAFNELDLHRVEAEIYDYNKPSLQLAEKLGFKVEGRLREAKYYDGKYHDIIRLGLLKSEY